MDKKTIGSFVAVAAVLWSNVALAGDWGGHQEVLKIYPSTSVNGIYITQSSMIDPDQCGYTDFYVLSKDHHTLFDEIYSLVLAARVSGIPVNFHVAGCTNQRPADSSYKGSLCQEQRRWSELKSGR